MKRPWIWICLPALAAATASVAVAAPQTAVVRCKDNSSFKCRLLEIGSDRARIEADFLTEPAPLRIDQIMEITLPPTRGEFTGDHIATATLSNGDMLRGELTGVTASEITLRTWYGGEIKLRRTMVDTLEIQDRPDVIYAGPTGLEGWTMERNDGWAYEDGVLRSKSPGSISRKLELPPKVHFAFDVSWRTNPRFRFIFFSDNIDAEEPENCYMLSVVSGGRLVELRKRTPRNTSQPIGNPANVGEFQNREKVRMELLVDRKTGLIQLMVNGRIAADWIDPEPQVGKMGGGIHFDALDSAALRFSRIEVTSWDGVVEGQAPDHDELMMMDEDDEAADKKEEPEPDPTRIRLRNSDHVEGEMLGIENGKVKLKTRFGEMNLPVSRLRSFPLRTKKEKEDYKLGLYEKPKRYQGDIRAWFADGSHVTFRLESSAGERFKGFGQAFGQADFEAKAFSKIEFNLYDPDLEAARGREER